MGKKSQSVDSLGQILSNPFRRTVFLQGYGTGNPLQLGMWHKKRFNGKSLEESFLENCLEFLVTVVEPHMEQSESHVYGQTLFDVYASTEFVLMERDASKRGPLIEVPKVCSSSEFVKDLGFDELDYAILYGTVKYTPSIEGFDELKTVKDCVNFVIARYRK
jgi:hypothetical protein